MQASITPGVKVVILTAARSAESNDLRFSSSHRRTCT